jgi:hypothetical protein
MKECAIYLNKEDWIKVAHLCYLYDNETLLEKFDEYRSNSVAIKLSESELTDIMIILGDNSNYKELKDYLQEVGDNAFKWKKTN